MRNLIAFLVVAASAIACDRTQSAPQTAPVVVEQAQPCVDTTADSVDDCATSQSAPVVAQPTTTAPAQQTDATSTEVQSTSTQTVQ